MLAVKIGVSRQIVIPKKAYDALGLAAGDYLEVAVERDALVMTPKTLIDKSSHPRRTIHADPSEEKTRD